VKKKKTKAKYRLLNWKDYNQSLVKRGSLTLWFSDEVLSAWRHPSPTGKRGHPRDYTDTAIVTMATLQEVYHLPLRQTEGLMISILELIKLELPVPDYSTLSRRRVRVQLEPPRVRRDQPVHVVIDSTGIKVFGEGEWKVRQHGYSYRRTWRKLHLGVDEASGEILAAVVSTSNYNESEVLPDLLDQIEADIEQVSGDGAYDKRSCYETIGARQARAAIPPQHNAKIWQHGNTKAEPLARDENLRRIRAIGRGAWKRESGYHRRSLAETAVFRIKVIFGDRVLARSFGGGAAELLVRCAALNRMTQLGMPDSYKV
jgi:IS5 family transposase